MSRRTPRKIRFHDHEWDEIVAQAETCGLPAATFVRKVSLSPEPHREKSILMLGRIATELERLRRLTAQSQNPAIEPPQLQLALVEALAAIERLEGGRERPS